MRRATAAGSSAIALSWSSYHTFSNLQKSHETLSQLIHGLYHCDRHSFPCRKRGVLFLKMTRKIDAEKGLATLKTLKPKLATELEHAIQTGNEE
jgi:hypothetical protein